MKKIYSFVLAAVAILSAASCQKELANAPEVENGEKFTVVATAAETKTVLDGVNTYWTPGDQIVLYNENGEEVTFSTNITETAATAVFTAESAFVPHAEGLLAVYPKRTDLEATSYADDVISGLHIGVTQTAVAGSFDPKYAVAVGLDDSKDENEPHLGFINVHSLVKFTVGGETAPSKVTLKNNGERKIAGVFDLNLEAAKSTVVADGAKEITLNGPFEVGKTYYIVLTHGVCDNGISLYFDNVEMKNTGKTIDLEFNKIYNLGTLPAPAEPEVPTIEEVIAAGAADAAETVGTVVATYTRGALLNDGTAYILIYNGSALDVAVGDKVHVSGKTSMYGGMLQFAQGSVVTVLSSGNEVVHPEPAVLDGAGMDDILTKTSVQYIEYTGNLAVSGYYYNVTVDGAATAIGSLQYIDAAAYPAAVNGADIKVRGYFIGVSSGKYVNTMTVSVEQLNAPEQPEEPEQPGAPVVATVAEFLAAAEDATVYQLTGEITSVTNTEWGNFYLKDGTGEVLIYGLCSPAGTQKYWAESGVKVGDTITVQTVRSSYNGTPQGKNAIYVSHVAGEGTEPEEPEEPETPVDGEYSSNVKWTLGEKSYSEKATINGVADVPVLKLGTSSVVGSATFTIPAGTEKIGFYGVAWKGKKGTLTVSIPSCDDVEFSFNSNTGAANNTPYTMTVTAEDYYEVELGAPCAQETTVTLATVAGATRVILFGINAE